MPRKRRRKGVIGGVALLFHTSTYVVDFIVKNTVEPKIKPIFKQAKTLFEKGQFEESYRKIREISNVKILDPAFGSASFLIKAFDLICQYYDNYNQLVKNYLSNIRKLDTKNKGPVKIKSIGEKVLLENIYGVDVDKQAVEVAKLNLWARLLQRYKEHYKPEIGKTEKKHLPSLELNLKHGNSLISSVSKNKEELEQFKEELKKIIQLRKRIKNNILERTPELGQKKGIKKLLEDYEKLTSETNSLVNNINEQVNINLKEKFEDIWESEIPFNWEIEFPEIFFDENGNYRDERGFDSVIGNPPYERAALIVDNKEFYEKEFEEVDYGACDIYVYFIARGINLLKNNGNFGYITSNKYLVVDYGKNLISFLVNNCLIEDLVDLTECPSTFKEALVSPLITICKKTQSVPNDKTKIAIIKKDDLRLLSNILEISNDIDNDSCSVEFRDFSKLVDQISGHILIYQSGDKDIIMNEIYQKSELLGKLKDIDVRTGIMGFKYWAMEPLVFEDSSKVNQSNVVKLLTPSLIDNYRILWGEKEIKIYGKKFTYPKIKYNSSKINKNTWALFNSKKIFVRGIARRLSAALDSEGYGLLVSVHAILSKGKYESKFLLALLNSTLFNWIHLIKFYGARIPQGSLRYTISFLKQLPIIDASKEQQDHIISLVDRIISLKNQYYSLINLLPDDRAILFQPDSQFFRHDWHISLLGDTKIGKWKDFKDIKIGELKLKAEIRILIIYHPQRGEIFRLSFDNDDFVYYMSLMFACWIEHNKKRLFKEKIELPSTRNILDKIEKILNSLQKRVGEINIVKIEKEIDETYEQLDEYIFDLYGLNQTQKDIVREYCNNY